MLDCGMIVNSLMEVRCCFPANNEYETDYGPDNADAIRL